MLPFRVAILTCVASAAAAILAAAGPSQLRSGSLKELAAGKVLVAARGLPDPNFAETVILLARHGEDGSMGLVINQRTDVPVGRVFPQLTRARGRLLPLYVGGPVSRDGVLALHRSPNPRPEGGGPILDDIYLIATADGIHGPIDTGADQSRFRVYAGYAGWGAGQLGRETAQGVWHVFTGEPAVVFDADPDTLWQRQVRRTEDRMARLRLPASARQVLSFP